MKYFSLITIVLIFFAGNLSAQEIRDYHLYNQNPILYNPADALNADYLRVYLNSHLQWMNLDGAPRNNEFGTSLRFMPSMGAGLSVTTNKMGLFNYVQANLKYAYGLKISKDQVLNMGLSLGVNNDQIRTDRAQNVDMTDEKLTENYFNKTVFSSGIGFIYRYKDIEAQLSMPQIFEYGKANVYTIGVLAYNFKLDDTWVIKPSLLARGVKTTPGQFDANLAAYWNNLAWVQFGYRTNTSFVMSAGVNFSNYSVGYAYQADTKPLSSVNSGTHEIQLIYRLQKDDPLPAKVKLYGNITDKETRLPMSATVKISESGSVVYETLTDPKSGFYTVDVDAEKTYSFEVVAPEYKAQTDEVLIDKNVTEREKNFVIEPNLTKLTGRISDARDRTSGLKSEILVLQGNKVIDTLEANNSGEFNTKLKPRNSYTLKASSENYNGNSATFQIDTQDTYNQDIELTPKMLLTGTVTDAKTRKPLGVSIEVFDENTQKVYANVESDPSTGKYQVELKDINSMSITAANPEYMFQTESLLTDNVTFIYVKDIQLQAVSIGASIVLNNVNFDYNKATLRPESITEINRLIDIMKMYPDVYIEISGHTDNTGSAKHNESLSKNRAQAVVDYIVSKGIDKSRLQSAGYGDSKPRATNDTDDDRQLNRRVEAKVIDN